MRRPASSAEGICAGWHISQLRRLPLGLVGSELPLTGGQTVPWKELSQALVPIRLVVGSQRTDLFKVTFLSCFPQRSISGKMCLKILAVL